MYDISINVNYNNNHEFRENLRQVFKMNSFPTDIDHTIDNISKDELMYDENAAQQSMDFILNSTQSLPFFKDLYLITASRFFSEDPGIGLSIMFSYDNFKLFHLLLREYFSNPLIFNHNNDIYIQFKKHIS